MRYFIQFKLYVDVSNHFFVSIVWSWDDTGKKCIKQVLLKLRDARVTLIS